MCVCPYLCTSEERASNVMPGSSGKSRMGARAEPAFGGTSHARFSTQESASQDLTGLGLAGVSAPIRTELVLRPISLLTLSLLRFVDSNFLGNSLCAWEFHPRKIKILLESNPVNSRILVRRLAVYQALHSSPAGWPALRPVRRVFSTAPSSKQQQRR